MPCEVYIAVTSLRALFVPDLGYGQALIPYRTGYSDEPLHLSSHVKIDEIADGSFGRY